MDNNELIKHRSWIRRNITWLFPAILVLITVVYLFISGIGAGNFAQAYADMPLFQNALSQAQENSRVKELLGDIEPIDKMTITEGAVQYAEDGSSMTSTVTLKGTKGKGKMDISAVKVNGQWQYNKIGVRIKETKEEINILEAN